MSRQIPNQDYVKHYNPALKHHRDWLLAVLDELTILSPEALSEGRLRNLWTSAPAVPAQPKIPHRDRWLRVIRYAEGTLGENGYTTTFSYGKPIRLDEPHPGRVNTSSGYSSDASGAYQFLSKTWKDIAVPRGSNPIMSVANQDAAAAALARRRGVDIDTAPFTRENVAKLAPEWASLPTLEGKSFYEQPVKDFMVLEAIFRLDTPLPRPKAQPVPPAPTPPAGGVDPGLPRGAAEDGRFGVMAGPKKRVELKPGDSYLVVNGPAKECRAYDHRGHHLWTVPALCVGQGRDWRASRGDTPAGLYRIGKVYRDYKENPSPPNTETSRAYGWYSFDLVDLEGQEADNGRAGIMIHGGGSAAGWPGAWAPLQRLHPTLGCIRMHNTHLGLIDRLVDQGRVFVGVWQLAL